MIHIAIESNDPFGSYICAGTIGMFTFQVFQNIGMTIGLLPITGITLPLMSYGGSSLLIHDSDWICFERPLKNENLYVQLKHKNGIFYLYPF